MLSGHVPGSSPRKHNISGLIILIYIKSEVASRPNGPPVTRKCTEHLLVLPLPQPPSHTHHEEGLVVEQDWGLLSGGGGLLHRVAMSLRSSHPGSREFRGAVVG